MKNTEVVYIAAVIFIALVFAGLTLSHADKALSRIAGEDAAVGGAAGKARDVDLELIRRLIRAGYLSDHEAEFYKQVTVPPGGPAED